MAATPASIRADAVFARARAARWRRSCEGLGPASSVQTLLETGASPLVRILGFDPPTALEQLGPVIVGTLGAGTRPIVLLVSPWGTGLDGIWRLAVAQAVRRRAAWSLVFNGTHLRVVDADRLYARRFLQVDLDLVLDDERAFAAFWTLTHVSAFATVGSGRSRLGEAVEQSQRHAAGVSRSLREGVLAASTAVLEALLGGKKSGRAVPPLDSLFEQALTIVYRILFLLFAEARGLVPLWHPIYRDSYSFESLRLEAERARPIAGLWDALRASARLAHAGCEAGELRVTAFNGRLFAPGRTPLAERRDLDDAAGTRALLALTTRPASDKAGLERITYRDLGVEQLGSVYETLLDYEPRVQRSTGRVPAAGRPVVTLARGSGARKATGSFYTPQPIADYLVRRVLGPLVQRATPDRILQLRVVDPSMGSGAFLVAACVFLAEAYEAALIRDGGCRPDDFGDHERAVTRRTVAERCLYGVDVNPTAVQLGRLSLWLATLAADRPLTFLDHHLQAGDSLLGAWLTNVRAAPELRRARKATEGAAVLPFPDAGVGDALRAALPVRYNLETAPNDSAEQVRAKERALAALSRRDTLLSKWKRIADVWCAPWFADPERAFPSAAFGALSDAILNGSGALSAQTSDRYLRSAGAIAESRRLFHWELEFPEVFFDVNGTRLPNAGFDAVIGNPPWDMIRADWGSADDRQRARDDVGRLLRFTRDGGVYAAQSTGHANRYQLFLERSIALAKHGGRVGLVLPSGLATDHGSASLRRRLFADCAVDAIVGFDNQRGIFPIHRGLRFLLVTATKGSPTVNIACKFGERDPSSLEGIGEEPAGQCAWFPVRLSPDLLRRVSGADLAIPEIRTAVDLAVVERAAALFAPLGSPGSWSARFGRELNATDDRAHFRPLGAGLVVVEGKHIEPFRVNLHSARYSISSRAAVRLVDSGRFGTPRLAYRDVASATNRLTLIAAVLPAGCVSTHTLSCLRTPLPRRAQDFLCGLFNSLVVNYLVRLRVTTHVTTGVVERLPGPSEHHAPGVVREIAALARLLSRRSDVEMWARLQAIVAGLYQLSAAELDHVLDTFPLIPANERAVVRQVFASQIRSR